MRHRGRPEAEGGPPPDASGAPPSEAPGEAPGEAEGGNGRPRPGEIVLGIVLVAIAAIGIADLLTDEFLAIDASGGDPGPRFFPLLMLSVLGAGGVLQIAICLLRMHRAGGLAPDDGFGLRRLSVPLLLIVSLVLYQMAILRFGYIGPSVVFAAAWLPIVHWRSGHALRAIDLVRLPIEAIVMTATLYILFRYAILVPLP